MSASNLEYSSGFMDLIAAQVHCFLSVGVSDTLVLETALAAVSISSETTATFTWSSNNDFLKGQRVRIYIDPTNAPNYVTATSVWKFTI